MHEGTKFFSFQEGILVGAEYKGEPVSLISYQPRYSICFTNNADRHKFHKILEAINFDSFDDPVKEIVA
jgi:hypothetical protein